MERAKTPRNVDPKLTADEARESFSEKFPDVDLDDLFANLLDRQRARHFNTMVSRTLVVDALGRAFPPGAVEPVKYWHQQLIRLNEHDAKMVGNLGTIESLVSDDFLKLIRTLAGVDSPQMAQMVGEIMRLPPAQDEKVVECSTAAPAQPK